MARRIRLPATQYRGAPARLLPMHLCAHRLVAAPADDEVFGIGRQPRSCVVPELGPRLWVPKLAGGIAAATRHEIRERRATGWLTGWVVPQIKAPAAVVADVAEGVVAGVFVKEDHVAGLRWNWRDAVQLQDLVGNSDMRG